MLQKLTTSQRAMRARGGPVAADLSPTVSSPNTGLTSGTAPERAGLLGVPSGDVFAKVAGSPSSKPSTVMPGRDPSVRRSIPPSPSRGLASPTENAMDGATMAPGKKAKTEGLVPDTRPVVEKLNATSAKVEAAKKEFQQAQKDYEDRKPGATYAKVVAAKRKLGALKKEMNELQERLERYRQSDPNGYRPGRMWPNRPGRIPGF